MKICRSVLLASASLMSFSVPAFAQQVPQSAEEAADEEDIIVTGTLIRGTAPVGSNSLSLGQAELQSTGAISSNALLASIPQVTNYFNRVPVSDLAIAVNQIQVSRPNIRNISGNNASSSATLILVDGHRIASAGVNQASIDPDLIPTGAIARVEVVTEGGSATYGADAVAGVINFITLKKFDGVKVGGHYGFAKNYWQYDANATVGKTWENGSAYISYSYTKSDALFGRDRDYIRNLDYSAQPYRGRDIECPSPNLAVNTVIPAFGVTIGSVTYAAPGFVANTSNRCDDTDNSAIVPRAERHGVLGGLSWDFGDSTSLDMRAYWGQRKTRATSPLTGQVTVNANNPYAATSLPAGLTLGVQPFTVFGQAVINQAAVNFSLAPLLGVASQRSDTSIREYGARAELTHDLGENWQVRALANWSQSDSRYDLTGLSAGRLNAAGAPATPGTTASSFNPFNVVNNNAALISDLIDNEIFGQTKDKMIQLRLIGEGKLFELPAGEVRLALGYEYVNDKLKRRFDPAVRIGATGAGPVLNYSRNVHSLFGEINAPLIARNDDGAMLTVSGSGRYDKYSDFGSTFNPKFGATFEPVKGFKIRGNWGTSFTAPTPVDQLGSIASTVSSFGFVPFTPAAGPAPLPGGNNTIAFQGSRPNLLPQEADTWSLGVDLTPTQGLRFTANYYSVSFANILGTPTSNNAIFTDFPNNVLYNINGSTPAQVTSFLTSNGTAPLTAAQSTQLANLFTSLGGGRITEVVDFRVGNFGILKVNGIDGGVNFNRSTGFGGVDFALNFNIPLTRKQQASPTAGVADVLNNENPQLYLRADLGFDIGNFRAQGTLNHTGGYKILPTTSVPVQERVGAFNTVDLFFKYDVGGSSLVTKDLSLTLNISNVFNQNPPVLLRNNPNETGFANGFTLGRLIQIGLSKKF